MPSKYKIDVNILLYVFQEYEKGNSFQYLIDSLQLDININTLYVKYKNYKINRINTLLSQHKNNRYSKDLKLKIVNEYFNSNLSTDDLAIKYKIRSSIQINKWMKMYTEGKEMKDYYPKPEVYMMKARTFKYC